MSVTSKSTCTGKTSKKAKKDEESKAPKDDFMDRFYPPDKKLCSIIRTRNEEVVDPFYPYRPKTSREYLDYNISQTEAKMDCGPYKIHYSCIRAEYEKFPPDYVFPVKKKKKHPQHGRGPVWVFLDEILKAKIEKLQAIYRYEHKMRMRIKNKLAHTAKQAMLSKIIENALPEWFHELSNQQLNSVDHLYKAMLRDLHYHTICNVQDIIAKLGLVLRPNHLYVEKALNLCCKCPIRFLSLIYIYRRRKRQDEAYDLNDKILLSSIVHLVLPMILKEMHIRIPSPPPREPLPPQPEPPKPKKKKYASPYLEPYTFKREPQRTGIYKNNHIQYPESPYFIYLREYYLEMYINQLGDEEDLKGRSRKRHKRKHPNYQDLSPLEIELNHEREGAQQKYDEIFEGMVTPRLLRANVFPKCVIERPEVEVSVHEESFTEEQEHSGEINDIPQQDQSSPPNGEAQDDNAQQDVADESFEGEGETYEESSEFVTIDMAGYCRDHPCCKTKKIYRLPLSKEKGCGKMPKPKVDTKKKGKQKYNSDLDDDFEDYGTESYTDYDSDALPDLSPEENYPMYANVLPICGGIVYHPIYKWVPIITGIIAPDTTCGCNTEPPPKSSKESLELFKRRKKVETGECTCIEVFLKRQKKEKERQKFRKEVRKLCTCKICMCKDRIPRTPSPVPSVPSFIPPSDDIYPKPIPSKLVEIVEPPPFVCECKNIVQQRLTHMKEHIETEVEDNRKRSYLIADTTDDGKKIIGAIKAPKPCRCLEKYQARVERFEREKRIEFIQRALKSTKKVFFFGGIKLDADGKPIYMIAGVAGAKPCGKCVENKMEEVREEQRKAEMPILPAGRIQYHISGVRKTPQGNVYIISGTSASEPCNCMKLYDTFVMMHARCMQVYHRYMEKMENDTREYLQEMGPPRTPTSSSSSTSEKELGEGQGAETASTSTSTKTTTSSTTSSSTTPKSSSETSSGSSFDGCTCGPFPKEKVVEEEEVVGEEENEEVEEEEYSCGRYVILKEIPRDRDEQIKILQKVLEGLAIDGFPIANMPGAYKLPHFKIWLALRTKSYYTMKDREDMMAYSRIFWGELEKCHKAYKVPESLNIPDSIARKYTYGQAEFVKKWTDGLKESQYRQIKQTLISHGREFFPSLFTYELPTPTFRDAYFAYVPSKEEALFARFPWAPHEFRNYKQMRERRAAKAM